LSEETKEKISKNNCKYWLGKNITEEMKKKNSAKMQGIGLQDWKIFISKEQYGEEFNLKLKNKIRVRDNQVCMNCGIHREKLNYALTIHHINYDKKCNFDENLISLCKKCHGLTNLNREYWKPLFQNQLSKLHNYPYSIEGNIIFKLNEIQNESGN
jgi:hypothetical protein